MQIYTCSEQVYIYIGGVYLHMYKLTFTYMQLRSHAQKYTRVQIIHICIIYIPCVNQRMWTGLKTDELNMVHILSFINYMFWKINGCKDYTIRSEKICRSLQPWCMN